jgi:hypothetical protein
MLVREHALTAHQELMNRRPDLAAAQKRGSQVAAKPADVPAPVRGVDILT